MEGKEEKLNTVAEPKAEPKVEPKEEPKDESISEDIHLKKGDYRVHVYIEQARSLIPPADKDYSDPVFIVTTFGISKSTNAYSSIGAESITPIGEHIFIDGTNKTPTEIRAERICIQARDHKAILKDALLGLYEMDMTYLYLLPNHTMLHQWLILSNPECEDYSELKGYLKVSISVLHEDDKAIDLCQEEKGDRNETTMYPVHLKPKTMQIIVQVIKAEHLPVMDRGGTLDAYCIVKFAGAESKTSIIVADKANMSAMWCEEVLLPCMIPCASSSVKVSLMDHDLIGKDELVGSIFLNFEQLKKDTYRDYFWCNFYGAPPLATGPQAEYMSNCPNAASHWRGRLLLRGWIEEKAETIYKKTRKIKEKNFEEMIVNEFETGDSYELRAQVISASSLPFRSGYYKIRVEWSGIDTSSSEKNTQNGSIEWFEICKRRVIEIPKYSVDVLPDVIVYLMYDDDKVCFLRIPASECLNKNAPAKWRQFKVEKCVGKIKKMWNPGFVRIKVYIGVYVESLDEGNWSPLNMPEFRTWILYSHLFQARDLPAADKNGLADPYIKIYCAGTEISTKSKPCELTLNPRWYQTFTMPISIANIEDAAPIVISLFDFDLTDADDFLGTCLVELTNAVINADVAPKPKWVKLKMGENEAGKGDVLVSFTLSSNISEERTFNIVPVFTDKSISINILGLRDLKPAVGWLPVHKAFLRFDLNSLELPGISQSVKPIETQPFDEGSDPNILTTLSAKVKMPTDPLYSSVLTVTVHDYLFKGVSQPLIGSFSIDIGKYFFPSKLFADGFKRVLSNKATLKFEEKKIKIEEEKKEIGMPSLDFFEVCNNEKLMIIKPTFELKGKKLREVNHPDPEHYIAIGYNRVPDDNMKYYRWILNDIFEKTHIFSKLPFEEFTILKGQQVVTDDSFLSVFKSSNSANEKPPPIQEAGKFKALVKISDYPLIEKDVEFEAISKRLLNKKKCVVRVYILNAFEIEQKDRNSLSDPYVKIKLAGISVSDRDNHKEDCTNPDIYRVFDMHTMLPGKSVLKIQMWDYNQFTRDAKIGTTRIDLENRFFNDKWINLKQKPVETRPLMIKTSKRPQGYVRLWVEIFEDGIVPKAEDISIKPPATFEARLIVWKSEDVPSADIEDLSDLYIVGKLNQLPDKQTDTHFRAANGRGSWNWRLKYSITLPNPLANILKLQVWDKDFLSGNDLISECSIEFDDIAKEAWEDDSSVQMIKNVGDLSSIFTQKKSNIFWVQCKNNQGDNAGKLSISFELIPQVVADNNKVGEGRDEPNHSPVLGPPAGRFKVSLNPFTMIGQLVGPEVKRKAICIICCIACIMLISITLPMFWTDVISHFALNYR